MTTTTPLPRSEAQKERELDTVEASQRIRNLLEQVDAAIKEGTWPKLNMFAVVEAIDGLRLLYVTLMAYQDIQNGHVPDYRHVPPGTEDGEGIEGDIRVSYE